MTKNYALDVTRVLKEVDILQSQTEAEIALISATANVSPCRREASVLVNQAEADALQLEQSTKALWCADGVLMAPQSFFNGGY